MKGLSILGISTLLIELIAVGLCGWAQNIPVVSISSKNVAKGETFDVFVQITNAVNIGYIAFDINYDARMLLLASPPSLCSISEGSLFATNPEVFPSGSGGLKVNIVNPGGISSSGDILRLSFMAAGKGESLIELRDVLLSDLSGNAIVAKVTGGRVVSSTPWEVNGDGVVDIFDIDIIRQHFGESPPKDQMADVNKDGTVDIFDLVLVGLHFGEK
jgi:hypothetical protein